MADIKTVIQQRVPSRFWFRDTNGFPSVTVTILMIAFIVTTLAFVASIFVSIGPIAFRAFDVAACGAYFTPILALYFGRKWTDAKYTPSISKVDPPSDGTPVLDSNSIPPPERAVLIDGSKK